MFGNRMFFNLFPRCNKLEKFKFKLEKKYWDLETRKKSWKIFLHINSSEPIPEKDGNE